MIATNSTTRPLRLLAAAAILVALPGPLMAQARSDFNGDGTDDLAIGVPYESVGSVPSAGQVNVIYGAVDSRITPGPRLTADHSQFWTEDRVGVDPSETGDEFGKAMAVGDFNGDGRCDLAIGAPGEDAGAGAVLILYGSPTGLVAAGSQWWRQGATGHGVSEAGDRFGHALVAGDFNRDGRHDLAIGAPGENDGAGAVNILYGSATGLTPTGSQLWTQDSPSIAGGMEAGDSFGASLGAGDFGNSVHTDLAIGVPREDLGDAVDAGAVHILYGSPGGLTATGSQLWTQDSPGITGEAESGDRFGSSLAVGNFGWTPHADLAIGVPSEDIRTDWLFVLPSASEIKNVGAVNVLYGGSAGLSSEGSHRLSRNSMGGNVVANESLGWALAAGNFGRSSEDDLAIGVPGARISENWEASPGAREGEVIVVYGSPSGLLAEGPEYWSQSDSGAETPDGGDWFGGALAAANFGGSSHADLAIGAPFERYDGAWGAGVVHVFYGTSNGLTKVGNQLWGQQTPGIAGLAEADDQFGGALPTIGR